MKRLILLLTCFSILHAGALWALEGCLDFGSDHDGHYEDHSSGSTHDANSHANHSHTDSSRVHCPNPLSEFLVSSLISLSSDNIRMHSAIDNVAMVNGLVPAIALAEGDGPPGLSPFKTFPRHLLLSVIRI